LTVPGIPSSSRRSRSTLGEPLPSAAASRNVSKGAVQLRERALVLGDRGQAPLKGQQSRSLRLCRRMLAPGWLGHLGPREFCWWTLPIGAPKRQRELPGLFTRGRYWLRRGPRVGRACADEHGVRSEGAPCLRRVPQSTGRIHFSERDIVTKVSNSLTRITVIASAFVGVYSRTNQPPNCFDAFGGLRYLP
jgi:hypothetical protein